MIELSKTILRGEIPLLYIDRQVDEMDYYHGEETGLLRKIISWMVDIVVVLTFAAFTMYAFGYQVKISGPSMEPLLQSDDIVLVNRLLYDFKKPSRFDVVVFERDDNRANVKRIIGLPGETVQITGGYIYINGELLEAEDDLNTVSLPGMAESPIYLGSEEYFLLGDNRDSSEDSRFVNVGNVNQRQILGKVWFRFSPFLRIGLIKG